MVSETTKVTNHIELSLSFVGDYTPEELNRITETAALAAVGAAFDNGVEDRDGTVTTELSWHVWDSAQGKATMFAEDHWAREPEA